VSRRQVGPGRHPPPQDAPEPAARRTGSHPASTSAGRPCLRAGRALAHYLPWARASGPPCPFILRRRTEVPNPSYTAPLLPRNPRLPAAASFPLRRRFSAAVNHFGSRA
jgi:hypothetical protein